MIICDQLEVYGGIPFYGDGLYFLSGFCYGATKGCNPACKCTGGGAQQPVLIHRFFEYRPQSRPSVTGTNAPISVYDTHARTGPSTRGVSLSLIYVLCHYLGELVFIHSAIRAQDFKF